MSIRFFLVITGMVFLLVGCAGQQASIGAPGGLSVAGHVDADMAQACIIAAANRYYLPVRVIRAVDARKAAAGSTQITMKVDLRDALCTVSASGNVHSVVDTTPKEADWQVP